MENSTSELSIQDYELSVAPTDRLDDKSVRPALKGLFGEIGSLISVSKKQDREGDVFRAYQRDLSEEIGDVFWYIAAICRRQGYSLEKVLEDAGNSRLTDSRLVAPGSPGAIISKEIAFKVPGNIDDQLFQLGNMAGNLLAIDAKSKDFHKSFLDLVAIYLSIVQSSGLVFQEILLTNQHKACGRFVKPDFDDLPIFDEYFDEDEQLPRQFEIEVRQKKNGKSYLRWHGVFIGDPLTDNIEDKDGYRFHDVFHFAHAAILNWSPVFRALIKHKRKSDPEIDENQDSGRAIVIEEGVSAYIFAYAKQVDFFANEERISFDLLKTISNFVRGYEVESCPLYMWEHAILEGYKVFRKLKEHEGGIILGNLENRSIEFKEL